VVVCGPRRVRGFLVLFRRRFRGMVLRKQQETRAKPLRQAIEVLIIFRRCRFRGLDGAVGGWLELFCVCFFGQDETREEQVGNCGQPQQDNRSQQEESAWSEAQYAENWL